VVPGGSRGGGAGCAHGLTAELFWRRGADGDHGQRGAHHPPARRGRDEESSALVAGAVAGGGLTVIANAPNPAGFAILKDSFDEQSINPFGLFAAALPPTAVAIGCLWGLRAPAGEFFDLARWAEWFAALDRGFLFLLLLPFVVAAVGLWAEFRDGKGR
jgi:hypothetical protein